MLTVDSIKQRARELGFDLVGVTDAAPLGPEHINHFRTWIDAGHAGCMKYMQRNLDKRTHPDKLLNGAQSVIVVGLNYKAPEPTSGAPRPGYGDVARYACYEDYHGCVKRRLFLLAEFIEAGCPTAPGFKVCVDTVPLAERALAVRAGLGFIGRNHMLIHPVWGQEIFLGELITTVALPSDAPCTDTCGPCRRCMAACPTGALRADGQLDARKCINYLTIELDTVIPPALAAQMGSRVYGCDACVTACPRQAQTPLCQNTDFRYYPERRQLDLRKCLDWNESMFQQQFRDSPVLRIGLARLQRNARICLDNG